MRTAVKDGKRTLRIRSVCGLLLLLLCGLFLAGFFGSGKLSLQAGFDESRPFRFPWGMGAWRIRAAEGKPAKTRYRAYENVYSYRREMYLPPDAFVPMRGRKRAGRRVDIYGCPVEYSYFMDAFFRLKKVSVELEPGKMSRQQAEDLLERVRRDIRESLDNPKNAFISDGPGTEKPGGGKPEKVLLRRDYWEDGASSVWMRWSWNEATNETHITVYAFDSSRGGAGPEYVRSGFVGYGESGAGGAAP